MRTSGENLKLQPYNLHPRFVFGLHKLVNNNRRELYVDFPTVPERYRTMLDTMRSVRRAVINPDIEAFGVIDATKFHPISPSHATLRESLIGELDICDSLWVPKKPEIVGVATLITEDEDEAAAYGAWWVDKVHRRASIGVFAATSLIEAAKKKGFERLNAYIRPANIASTEMVKELGFKRTGKPGLINLGDEVTADRQAFTLELT